MLLYTDYDAKIRSETTFTDVLDDVADDMRGLYHTLSMLGMSEAPIEPDQLRLFGGVASLMSQAIDNLNELQHEKLGNLAAAHKMQSIDADDHPGITPDQLDEIVAFVIKAASSIEKQAGKKKGRSKLRAAHANCLPSSIISKG